MIMSQKLYLRILFVCVLSSMFPKGIFNADIHVGVIFYENQPGENILSVVRFAFDTINNDSKILPNHTLVLDYNFTRVRNPFHNMQTVCAFTKKGVSVLIGPYSSTSVKATHPLCSGLNVPMIAPAASDPTLSDQNIYNYLIRMTPPDSNQSQALVDFVQYFRYDTMAILTDNTDYGINGLVDFQQRAAERNWRILNVLRFPAEQNASLIDVRPQLRNIKASGARVILLNCMDIYATEVLAQAHHEGMVEKGWMWIATDGTTVTDLVARKLETNRYLKGLIGTRSVSRSGELYHDFVERWRSADPDVYPGASNNSFQQPESYPLAYYDSVLVVAHAFHQMLEVDKVSYSETSNDCKRIPSEPWNDGKIVLKYLRKVDAEGVRKHIKFDTSGAPVQVAYEVVILEDDGWNPIGIWNASGIHIDIENRRTLGNTKLGDVRDHVGDLVNKSLRVVTIVEAPYVMKSDNISCQGNDCFYGLAIDLLNQLATDLKFSFTLYDVSEGGYGSLSGEVEGEEWTGLIKHLIPDELGNTKADLGVGSITISHDRQQQISYTKPYRDLELGIAIGTPKSNFNQYSFLEPLTKDVWIYTLLTGVAVAIIISIEEMFSPYGHHGRKVQIGFGDPDEDVMDTNEDGEIDEWELKEWNMEKHKYSLLNSIFWTFGCYLQQGVNPHPCSWSGRVSASAWWFGTLIITSTYTANLAAFMTIKAAPRQIESVEDLVRINMKYSTVANSQPLSFFNAAEREPYRTIGDRMRADDMYFANTSEAIEYTEKMMGSFAFIYDLPVLEYWKGQECRLNIIENGFARVGYGFPLPKGSIYTEELSIKILQYRESGYIDMLDNRWLYQTSNCSVKPNTKISLDNKRVEMESLMGVFWILMFGAAVAFVFLVVEWTLVGLTPSRYDKRMQSCMESIKKKLARMPYDVARTWFGCTCGEDPRPSNQR